MTESSNPQSIRADRDALLLWYDRYGRDLPWRYKNGSVPDPYHVWLSEIMCQQTTVQTVIPYFLKFIQLWPGVKDLAAAPVQDIMREWAGLGYYARARNLHKCAGIVANNFDGVFPQSYTALKALPGIGDYTAAAIAAIAFNIPTTVMDGNIERVIARYGALKDPLPASKPILKRHAARFFDGFHERPGDLAQAFMDLGANICTPKSPKCSICPIHGNCAGRAQGIAETLPAKVKKKPVPQKTGYVYWIENRAGEVLLERRTETAMLGGMFGFPTSDWVEDKKGLKHPNFIKAARKSKPLFIAHTFTHFKLKLILRNAVLQQEPVPERFGWHPVADLKDAGFPTVFQKAYDLWSKQD